MEQGSNINRIRVNFTKNIIGQFNHANMRICEKLNLTDCSILKPIGGLLKKLVTFVPIDHVQKVREAVFNAGAGQIGNYDSCSFNTEGLGSFRGDENTNPYIFIPDRHYVIKEKGNENATDNTIGLVSVFPGL